MQPFDPNFSPRRRLAGAGLGAALLATMMPVRAACPSDIDPTASPAFVPPPTRRFSSNANAWMASAYQPWHMVHDAVVREGARAEVVGKFDYDALLHKDLENERVDVFLWGTGIAAWRAVGTFVTDGDGRIRVPLGVLPVGRYVVRMVVQGDRSMVDGYVSVVQPGREAVLFDVDGTLTLHDFEAYRDYAGIRSARPYLFAPEVVKAYVRKGYEVVLLTARPYWTTRDARQWLQTQGLAGIHYHATDVGTSPVPRDPATFKAQYIGYLRNDVGLDIVRAYGNALTDVAAYRNAGLSPANTYIVGPNAGAGRTQPITGDYTAHYYQVVQATRDVRCRR